MTARCRRQAPGLATIAALAGACLILAPLPARAQADPAIVTDRPSFTNSPRVVGARTVQIEAGVAGARNDLASGTATRATAPNLLVRLGMSRRLEVRIESEGWVRQSTGRSGQPATSAASDVALAAEYQFARADGVGADLAVIAGITLPTGGAFTSSGNADPFARLVWNRPVTGAVSLGGTLNWGRQSVFGDRVRTLDASLVLGHPLGGAWSVFWEGVVRHRDVDADTTTWLANAGVLRRLGAHLQVDAWVGRGLNDAADDWRAGTGVGWRFVR